LRSNPEASNKVWIASQATNDKQKKHPPAPFKGGTFGHSSPFEGGRGMFLLFVISSEAKQSREPDNVRVNDFVIISLQSNPEFFLP